MNNRVMKRRPGYIDPMTWNNYLRQTLDSEVQDAMKHDDLDIMDDIAGNIFAGIIGYRGKLPSAMGGWSEWKKRLEGAVYVPREGIFPAKSINGFEGLGYIVPNESYFPHGSPVVDIPHVNQDAFSPNEWKDKNVFHNPDSGEWQNNTNSFENFLTKIQGGFTGYGGYTFGGPELGAEYFMPDDMEIDLRDLGVTIGAYNPNAIGAISLKKIVKKAKTVAKKATGAAKTAVKTVAKTATKTATTAAKTVAKTAQGATKVIKPIGKTVVKVAKATGKTIAKTTVAAAKKAYDSVKDATAWIANQTKAVKAAILSAIKTVQNTLSKYVSTMKSWVRTKALTIGVLKKGKLGIDTRKKIFAEASTKKYKKAESALVKATWSANVKAVANSQVLVAKQGNNLKTAVAVKKPVIVKKTVKKVSGLGVVASAKRLTKAQSAVKVKAIIGNVQKKNIDVRNRNKSKFAKLLSAEKLFNSAGNAFNAITKKIEPIVKKSEEWKKVAEQFLKNIGGAMKRIGEVVKSEAKKVLGIKGLSGEGGMTNRVRAERLAFGHMMNSKTMYSGIGSMESLIKGGGIVLTISVAVIGFAIGGPLLATLAGGITYILTTAIPGLILSSTNASKAQADAERAANQLPEAPEPEEEIPTPAEVLADLESQGYEIVEDGVVTPTTPATAPATAPAEEESYYEEEAPAEEYEESYEEPSYEESYEEPSYEESYEEEAPDEEYEESYEEEAPAEEYEESYEEEAPVEEEYEDEGGGEEYEGLGDKFNYNFDFDSDFHKPGVGFDVDISEVDTVIGTHTGLNAPRPDYRGSYHNVEIDNVDYKLMRGNSGYANSSYLKMPTLSETRPYKHEIDYSEPTSNPFYVDRIFANGLGELGGSDEFDVTDLTNIFGDEFDVEFNNAILEQKDPFDINNNNMFLGFGKLKLPSLKKKKKPATKPATKPLAPAPVPAKKKPISTSTAKKLYEDYLKARTAQSKTSAQKYKDYTTAVAKTQEEITKRKQSESGGNSIFGSWWKIFPTSSKIPGVGGIVGGIGKVGNGLFLIGTIGLSLWLGSKLVKLVTGTIKETSHAISTTRMIPPKSSSQQVII